MIDPLEIMKAGIKVYKIHQRPKDYACTFVKVVLFTLRPTMAVSLMASTSLKQLIS